MKILKWFKTDELQARWSFGVGITIWFLHLNTLNALTSLSCKWGWFSFTVFGMSGLRFIQLIFTCIALLLLAGMVYVPWRGWRKYQTTKPIQNPHLLRDTEQDRHPLEAAIAMVLNSFLFLFALAFFVPLLALNACALAS